VGFPDELLAEDEILRDFGNGPELTWISILGDLGEVSWMLGAGV